MEFSIEYRAAFQVLAHRMNFDFPQTPYEAVKEWKELVDSIKEGYSFVQPELDYDLGSIREPIEMFLVSADLAPFEEHILFKTLIQKIDEAFKVLSEEHPIWAKSNKSFRWWENRVLKYGSEEYADSINNYFGQELGFKVKIVR